MKKNSSALKNKSNDRDDRLAARVISEFVSCDPRHKLRIWLRDQREPFTLRDVAENCFKLSVFSLTRDVQTRLGMFLRNLGCTRFERRTATARHWYLPPLEDATELEITDEHPNKRKAK